MLLVCLTLPAAYAAPELTPSRSTSAPALAAPPKPAGAKTLLELPEPPPFQVVALITSDGRSEAVPLLFSPALDQRQAAAIVQHMAPLGGWQPRDLKIADDRYTSACEVWEARAGKPPAGELQTFVEFGAPGVINHREHWINLDPFILGLRDYTPLRVALALADDIAVTGPGNVTNNTVQIECSRQPNSVVFDITVKDSDLTATGVPTHPPTPPVSPTPTRPAPPPRRTPLYMLATGVLAAVAALALAARRKGIGPWATKRSACVPAGGSPAGAVGNEREDQGGD